MVLFRDRSEAGRELAAALGSFAEEPDVIVLGLPRGGVPVALEVAERLDAPLDVFVVRKLGVPGFEELAMGAVASGGSRVLNLKVVGAAGIDREQVEAISRRELREVERREKLYRGDRPELDPAGRTAVVVDDGLATGSTMRAAVAALRGRGAPRVVVGVPVASPDVCAELEPEVEDIVCARTPERFRSVGGCYEQFPQLTDEDVARLLARSRQDFRKVQ
jgi:predicted phosphoribosyltransferase